MADPLTAAAGQARPMSNEEYEQEMARLLSEEQGQPQPEAQPIPTIDEDDSAILEEGLPNRYAASREERFNYNQARQKQTQLEQALGKRKTSEDLPNTVRDFERSIFGVSPTEIMKDATEIGLAESMRTIQDIADSTGITEALGFEPGVGAENIQKWRDDIAVPDSVEKGASEILSYVAAFGAYNKLLKGAGIASNAIRWGTAGAMADAFNTDPFAEGFADLLKDAQIPGLSDSDFIEWLAKDGNEYDTAWENRLRNAVEGTIVGETLGLAGTTAGWAIPKMVGVFRNIKAAQKAAQKGETKAAEEALQQAVNDADELAKNTGQATFDPELMEWRQDFYRDKDVEFRRGQLYDRRIESAPLDPNTAPISPGQPLRAKIDATFGADLSKNAEIAQWRESLEALKGQSDSIEADLGGIATKMKALEADEAAARSASEAAAKQAAEKAEAAAKAEAQQAKLAEEKAVLEKAAIDEKKAVEAAAKAEADSIRAANAAEKSVREATAAMKPAKAAKELTEEQKAAAAKKAAEAEEAKKVAAEKADILARAKADKEKAIADAKAKKEVAVAEAKAAKEAVAARAAAQKAEEAAKAAAEKAEKAAQTAKEEAVKLEQRREGLTLQRTVAQDRFDRIQAEIAGLPQAPATPDALSGQIRQQGVMSAQARRAKLFKGEAANAKQRVNEKAASSGARSGQQGGPPSAGPSQPRGTVVSEKGKIIVRAGEARAAENVANQMKNGGINLDQALDSFSQRFNPLYMKTSDEALAVIGSLADELTEQGIKVDYRTTQKAVEDLAMMKARSPAKVVEDIAALAKSAQDMPSLLVSARHVMVSTAEHLQRISRQIAAAKAAGKPTDQLEKEMGESFSLLAKAIDPIKNVRHATATTTWSNQLIAKEVESAALKVGDALKQGGDNVDLIVALINDIPPIKVAELAAKPKGFITKLGNAITQWRLGAMLYGPRTFATNLVGTAYMGVSKPSFRLLGSLLLRDGKTMKDSMHVFGGMYSALGDSWKMSKNAFATNRAIGDEGFQTIELQRDAFQELFKGSGDAFTLAAKYVDLFSQGSMRVLTAQDEMFKQIAYRSYMHSKGMRQAMTMLDAGALKEADIDSFVKKYVDNSFDPDGRFIDEEGIQYSREATLTQDIGEFAKDTMSASSVSKAIQNAANSSFLIKQIFPFVRTPINLLSEGVQLTPGLQFASKRFRRDLFGSTPERKAEAVGKLAFGSSVAATAALYAASGNIVGAAPTDPGLRDAFLKSGRLPYSYYSPSRGRWVQFNRMDPLALPIGIIADATAAASAEGFDYTQVFASVALAIADNTKEKSYLTGVSDMMRLIGEGQSPDQDVRMNSIGKAAGSLAGSFVPNFIPQLLNPDDQMREVRSFMDGIVSRLPGASESLMPKRDALGTPFMKSADGWLPLIGETPNWVTPFAMALPADSPVREQLLEAQAGIKLPASKYGNIDMRNYRSANGQTAYDRWLELTGTIKGSDGKTVLQQLETFVPKLQEAYGNIRPQKDIDTGGEYKGAAHEKIAGLVGRYRNAAKAQMLSEFPELAKALREEKIRNSPAGRANAATRLRQ
jgi:hypothetical protein